MAINEDMVMVKDGDKVAIAGCALAHEREGVIYKVFKDPHYSNDEWIVRIESTEDDDLRWIEVKYLNKVLD